MSEVLLKLIKFCVAGGSGVLVDFRNTYLLKVKLKVNKYVSNSIGFITSTSYNYLLNRIWIFESINQNITPKFRFIVVSVIGLLAFYAT